MTDSALTVLRTAKAALDEGLLTPMDYKKVRDSFVAAQQIRAGLESGILKEEEVDQVKERFFQLLHIHSSKDDHPSDQPSPSATAPAPMVTAPAALAATRATGGPPPPPPPPPMMAKNVTNGARPAPPPMMPRTNSGESGTTSAASTAGSSRAPSVTSTRDPSRSAPPPSGPSGATVAGSRSLAGIQLDIQVTDEYLRMRTRRAYRWLTFRVDSGVIIVDQSGGPDSSHLDFVEALPPNEPRYAIYDHHFMSTDGLMFNKLVFVFWCPEGSPVKLKMLYAASQSALKQNLEGVSADVQASNGEEVSLENIDAAVKSRIMQIA